MPPASASAATSTDHEGRIVGLTGVATAPANLAIQPTALGQGALSRDGARCPTCAAPSQCNVGRTGRVTFGK